MSLSRSAALMRAHPMLLPLYLPSLIFAFSEGILIPILPFYAADFNASYVLIGLLLAAPGVGQLLGDVPAGMLLRRMNSKHIMLLGSGGLALMMALLFTTRTVIPAMILLTGVGACRALYNIARHTYITENVDIHRRGRVLATFGGLYRIGVFGGPALGGALAGGFGLRIPFLAVAAVGVVTAIIIWLFVEDTVPNSARSTSGHWHVVHTLRAHYRILLFAGVGQLFAQMIRAGRQVIVPLFAANILGMKVEQIGLLVTLGAAADMSTFYISGWIMDRYGRKYAIVPSFTLQAGAMALIPLVTSPAGLLLIVAFSGFVNGMSSGTMMALGSDLSPETERGEFIGLWRLIGDAGAAGAPIIVGTIAELLALQLSIWVLAGSGIAAAVIFAFFVPETLKRRKRKQDEVG